MFIDDVTIKVLAGKGGRGHVSFNSNMKSLGPTGAKGGNGGSVYLLGDSNLGLLSQFRYKKALRATDGEPGKSQYHDGNTGADLIMKVPVGTVVHNLTTGQSEEIVTIGQQLLVAQGGRGGKGNFHFRGPHNTSPQQFQLGKLGEQFTLRLELKLIADVGLVGLPNVGKSSFLNAMTNAKSKVANYRFTTLEPNLGVYYQLIIADIPGLIEGASGGKGLGIKFLRHIERTKVLFHFIAADSEDITTDYKTIRQELKTYNPKLLEKTEYLFLTKSDLLPTTEMKTKLIALKKLNKTALAFSIGNPTTLAPVRKVLNALKK